MVMLLRKRCLMVELLSLATQRGAVVWDEVEGGVLSVFAYISEMNGPCGHSSRLVYIWKATIATRRTRSVSEKHWRRCNIPLPKVV